MQGMEIFGYFDPPSTGSYTFLLASDDEGALYFGNTVQDAAVIASVPSWTEPRQWDKFPSQRSSPQFLTEGTTYYMRALANEGGGGQNLAVGVILPDVSEIA